MKALFLYNPSSGRGLKNKKLLYIKKELLKTYDSVDLVISQSKEHFMSECQKACENYDALIFSGGDGTFNMVVSALKDSVNKPILGMIPNGRLNDSYKTFGVPKSIKRALKVIKEQNIEDVDTVNVDNHEFIFSFSQGAYSDIPYSTKYKKLGRFIYYLKAIPRLFKKIRIKGKLIDNDSKNEYYFETPFILIMNGTYMGGFKINKHNSYNDGLVDIYLVKPGVFNGLLKYFFSWKKIPHFKLSNFTIQDDSDMPYDLDGEKVIKSNSVFHVHHNSIKVITKAK